MGGGALGVLEYPKSWMRGGLVPEEGGGYSAAGTDVAKLNPDTHVQ